MESEIEETTGASPTNGARAKLHTIALAGNPNSGKSSLFNQLTGLRQKIGNYPGITVDKKTGYLKLDKKGSATVVDLPGTYSIYPKSKDEMIVLDILINEKHELNPDLVIVIVDASNLKRNLLLLTQIRDLGYPVICALNMVDVAKAKGITIKTKQLQERLQIPVIPINARTGYGINQLKQACSDYQHKNLPAVYIPDIPKDQLKHIEERLPNGNAYKPAIWLNQTETVAGLSDEDRAFLRDVKNSLGHIITGMQGKETLERYRWIAEVVEGLESKAEVSRKSIWKDRLDKVLMHRVFGYIIFLGILFLIFQAIFSWAERPMDWIDLQFANLSLLIKNNFPQGAFVDMLSEGIVPGLGGIAIFIPQIAMLFAFIAILEDSGYMARVVFLMDKIMRRFGLSGKSVVPLISGVACAIPAIMATRNIENWKERIISIMVTPLMTCSARLPVYIILIALVVPEQTIGGVLNVQGLVLLAFYALGFVSAIGAAYIFKLFIKSSKPSFLVMEMPSYKAPRWRNVGITMLEKSRTFAFQAGKIIMAVSLILWVLASYGPGNEVKDADSAIALELPDMDKESKDFKDRVNAYKLEHSYVAYLGKSIEPAIAPLGFDWKIGIALITSFAAREVFVSTIATIYSVGSDFQNEATIKQRMMAEVNPKTGKPVYTQAVGFSLLIFYAFAMQCMSTLAIVYRETNGLKWPIIQFAYMSVMAYVSSLIVFQVLTRVL